MQDPVDHSRTLLRPPGWGPLQVRVEGDTMCFFQLPIVGCVEHGIKWGGEKMKQQGGGCPSLPGQGGRDQQGTLIALNI